jgi:antitoxin MazE
VRPLSKSKGRETFEDPPFPMSGWHPGVINVRLRRGWRGYTIRTVYLLLEREGIVQVAKWGNSLAVRLPSAVVEALDLKEGDQIEIRIAGAREFEVSRDRKRERALDRLRRLRRPLPEGFTLDRREANER